MLLCAKGKILLKNDKTDFTQGRILPKLAFFMLPILGALVLQAAYGAVDLLVVGRFGSTSGLSAVSTGSQVLNLVTFVVTQLAMGVTVLIARYLGEKRPQYIGQVIGGAAVVFTLLAAALFVVLVFFARLISSLMQAPAEALDLTASYVRICGSGIFFIVAYNMLSALFRGLGDSRSPLIFVLVACIVNVIGDLVLVAGFHLDAAGAAIATVAAQAVSVICAIAMLLKKELPFKIHRSDFKPNPQCKKFLGIGLPLALQEFLTQLSFLALCAFVNRLGLEASSGYGVACKIVNFAMLIPSSLMQSMPGTKEKILSGQFKVRDADMHRLARADFPNRKQIVHEILHPEDRPAPQSSYSHYSGINYSALEVAVRRIQQDFDFLMRYLPKLPDDSYAKTETLKILKQHKAYMAQFEEMLNDKEIA